MRLDLLYGMYSHVNTATELCHIVITDPFDRSETPRQLKLTELAFRQEKEKELGAADQVGRQCCNG